MTAVKGKEEANRKALPVGCEQRGVAPGVQLDNRRWQTVGSVLKYVVQVLMGEVSDEMAATVRVSVHHRW